MGTMLDWLGQPLPINYYPHGRSPLEGLVPPPPHLLTREKREEDHWLAKTCKEPDYLWIFGQLLEERKTVEARLEEFCFAPLKVTLRNMQTFITHIREGKQFQGPLTDKEDQALAWAAARTAGLLQAGAPYKRTVFLAIALMTLCEIITDRQVLGPLLEREGDARARRLVRMTQWSGRLGLAAQGDPAGCPAARLDPAFVATLSWGGNNRRGNSETEWLFDAHDFRFTEALCRHVHDQNLLIYPGFQELDIDDFCHFGHLALHPVGLITSYALSADGVMMSPLQFAAHDLNHLDTLAAIGKPEYQAVTEARFFGRRSDKRLAWRSLLLDQVPACLAPLNMEAALHLLIFTVFHETFLHKAIECFLSSAGQAFVACFLKLAMAGRYFYTSFSRPYQKVTDKEAAMAALWAVRVWHCWQATGYGQPGAATLERCAYSFVDKDLPQLHQHLDFIDHNRGPLRRLFADSGRFSAGMKDGHYYLGVGAVFDNPYIDAFFESYNAHSGLHNIDYTDIVYFAARLSPAMTGTLARRFGATLPAGTIGETASGSGAEAVMGV